MKILVAEDDTITNQMLKVLLSNWNYTVIQAYNGMEAWEILQKEDAPKLVLLDWMMPMIDGAEICRRVRKLDCADMFHIIFLTSRGNREDIVEAFKSGANDHIIKPFDRAELKARINVGRQITELKVSLADKITDLERALSHIKMLQGILPICSYCKKIRNDKNYWQQIESYFANYADVQFSHSICPDCYQNFVKPEIEKIKKSNKINDL